ncbi:MULTISPECIES: glycerol-3-phosphate responsive antiterminator [Priestia]|uniref:Glycerol uptake operon antiterminator regulatory protein n=1 Tax=Priestia megaterium TaxID=1404 RepID=A0ABD4WLM3_PRIMG|nr:glycerol-3-phosphate responsive antiterminator [Priestia megaterium]MCF6800311.1 glycerol-3-phosphate responsive antiterminator [Bacillus sp. ET1]MBD8848317.1 glycerol-3-phosphate responsive antiterminator [Priestia megaterium]MDD9780981.1 glycerol-3-phosphate responsive antiterminator [Priestia megaterium]MDN4860498.1 glycerol-3-phosphate responsive antiterminator [Priestia megaterium]MED3815087.1 glycerol-3-phosphate responsive antiterminator [Priestia megaterium]
MNKEADFLQQLGQDRLIASIKSPKNLEQFLETEIQAAFLLTGNISVIKRYVDLLKQHNRMVFLHIEKIPGISYDREGLKFLAKFVKPTGIVTTKSSLINYAKQEGLVAIQRLFLVDTDAVAQGLKTVQDIKPDALELMPGLIPEMIEKIVKKTSIPIITGGLIQNESHIQAALKAGATAFSTGKSWLWKKYE